MQAAWLRRPLRKVSERCLRPSRHAVAYGTAAGRRGGYARRAAQRGVCGVARVGVVPPSTATEFVQGVAPVPAHQRQLHPTRSRGSRCGGAELIKRQLHPTRSRGSRCGGAELIELTRPSRMIRISSATASVINSSIPPLAVLHGVAIRGAPWLSTQLHTFAVLITGIVTCCGGMQFVCCRWGARLQPDRRHAFVDGDAKAFRLLREELLETTRCMYVISCMAAWPLSRFAAGEPTGLIWRLDEAGQTLPYYLLGFCVGIPVADAWLYLKHRLLHTRVLWAFHSHHHTFRNPTSFGGFAVSPLEALWTFCPIFLWSHLPHWIPLVAPSIFAFFVLNCYLHSGFTLALLERVLPFLLVDSSAYHNVHHEKVTTHFGEISSFWDYMLDTCDIHATSIAEHYRWHLRRHQERSAKPAQASTAVAPPAAKATPAVAASPSLAANRPRRAKSPAKKVRLKSFEEDEDK